MTSDRQRAANQRNASKSTGPRTIAGKARARKNAFRHGFTARRVFSASLLAQIEELSRALASANEVSIADRRSIAQAECLLRQVRTTSAQFFDVLAAHGTTPGADRNVALSELRKLTRYQRRLRERRNRILESYNRC